MIQAVSDLVVWYDIFYCVGVCVCGKLMGGLSLCIGVRVSVMGPLFIASVKRM